MARWMVASWVGKRVASMAVTMVRRKVAWWVVCSVAWSAVGRVL